MKKQVFLYACAWFIFLFSFWAVSGQPFGRPEQADIAFHLERSADPLCFLHGCSYYAPLFHILVAALGFVFSLQAAFILSECIILFVLLPWTFYRLSNTLWGDECAAKNTVFVFLFGSTYAIVSVVAGIIPQALNTVFLVLGLEAMIRDQRTPSHRNAWMIALWGILSVLSHQKGWYLYALLVFGWLYVRNHYATCIMLIGAGILFFPQLTAYQLEIRRLPELALFWLNPVNLCLGWKGWKKRSGDNMLLDGAIIASVLLAWVDPNYRSLLTASILLSVYGGRALQEEKNANVYRFALLSLWVLNLTYFVIGVVVLLDR